MIFETKEKSSTSKKTVTARCYASHPKLKLGKSYLCGGSASYPVYKSAKVYVSLQEGSRSGFATDPWEIDEIREVYYPIEDGSIPRNLERFKKLVNYIQQKLEAGIKVHVGCIGGHGRTGMVLAAVVAQMNGEKDAITYVRKHYCQKAVESREQVDFLHKHYGVKKIKGSKEGMEHLFRLSDVKLGGKKSTGLLKLSAGEEFASWGKPAPVTKAYVDEDDTAVTDMIPEGVTGDTPAFKALAMARCIWKPRKTAKKT